ncbi:hypothetical protein BTO30_14835 [Domibacillus antri]|uniref:Uncharacterized protein n=1 Tax=Domibacillus antri TaxID=1714264 RepID=A0A1Q8Q219_9BACI|nr:baseplate J/gp47 family protein [Domibacillus antri]OLN21393.1 hypothetical protein BTO30_14835 [Domibacillus antri]
MVRFNLPDVQFVDKDVDEIETEIVAEVESKMSISLSQADPRRQVVKAIAYAFSLMFNKIDYTAKQTTLAYAEDDFLDIKGADKNVPRLEPIAATSVFRFEVNPIATMVIPAGYQISAENDSTIIFQTTESVTVDSAATQIDLTLTCTQKGVIGNDFLPGQISNAVKPLSFVSKVYNITTSSGGADLEDNDPYAERIRLSNERYSTAGPDEAYIYHAKSANQLIVDVAVDSPSDGVVRIVPLMANGEIPNQAVLDQVSEKCSAKKVRPLTDKVQVVAPELVPYTITLEYFISSEKESMTESIQASVQKAVEEYRIWQKSKLGRGIDSGELIALVKEAGASRVNLTAPVGYTALSRIQVASDTTVTVTYGGLTDD